MSFRKENEIDIKPSQNENKKETLEQKKDDVLNNISNQDEKSLEAKLSLIDKYNLAGAAYWQKDMETPSVWKLISEKLGIN